MTIPDTEEAVIDAGQFRQILGQYPTGVVVVAALGHDGEAIGMTVGSFTSVSLDPPLVAFLPDKASSSWRALRESGQDFCINVLGNHQEEVCRLVATRKVDKFAGIPWHPSEHGLPVIDGCVASIDCVVRDVIDAGDHHIVIGRVRSLAMENPTEPLLFFRGGYGSFTPLSLMAGDADLVDHLAMVDLVRGLMEDLAHDFDTQVTTISLVRNELVLTAAAGSSETMVAPTRVGQRLPFMPPVGSVFVAYGDDQVAKTWLSGMRADVSPQRREYYESLTARVRRQGFSLAVGHENLLAMERYASKVNAGDPQASPASLKEVMQVIEDGYNPPQLDPRHTYEFHLASAPVFTPHGTVAFTLNIFGPSRMLSMSDIDRYVDAVKKTAEKATAAIAGHLGSH
ncbi:flavin reductase [Arthrobacter sp. NPDC080073]|uniref:flavin reductase n=1 Tax=Arthrobacter sp. NPDC080073 TaxID=3155919 RepID=UPI003421879A